MNVPFRCKRVTLSSLLFIYLFITRTDVDDKAKKPGQVKNTGHKSLFYQHRNNQNSLPMLTLGLRLALMNVLKDSFCVVNNTYIQKT